MAELPPEPNTGRKEDDYENIHAGTVIFDKFHRMLLVLQENGRWSLPKGSIKYGESIYQGALRETFEETGIDLSSYTPVGIEEYELFGTSQYTLFIFKLPVSFKEFKNTHGVNSIRTEWVDYGKDILSHFKLNMLTVSFIRNSNNYIRNHKLNYKLTKSQQAMLESLKEPLFIPLDHSNHRGGYKTRRRRVRGTRRGKRRM